jgi:L-alanine-DL-glutamate epimerase-like enolase superfamily enzyme
MSLRVESVERVVVNVPFCERVRPWNEILIGQFGVIEICRVLTNAAEIVGYGETLLHYTWQKVSDAAIARVVGRNPAEFLADDTLGAGLQMALFDAVGQALEVPMHRLLSLPLVREWCPVSWWNTKAPPEVLGEEAKDALAAGYLAHKFKARPWFDVYEQVEAMAAVTPPTYRLDPDWNAMLLDVAAATEVLTRLDSSDRIGIYETPIPLTEPSSGADLEGYRLLRQRVRRPIAEHFDLRLFPHVIRSDSLDAFVVQDGGVAGFLRDAQLCASANKDFFFQIVGSGITFSFALQLAAVATHARWPLVTATNTYAEHLLVDPIEIRGGFARVPPGPGLGIVVDEDAIERLRMTPVERSAAGLSERSSVGLGRPYNPVLDSSRDSPFRIEYPRKLLSFSLGDGRVRHYAGIEQLWAESLRNGTMPRQAPGARLSVRDDDGTADFDEFYRRAAASPVWETGS